MEYDISGEIYNIGSTNRIRIVDLAHRVLELTDSSSELVYVPFEEAYGEGIEDMLHRIPSTEKIDAAIGWKPTFDLESILADVVGGLRGDAERPA